MYRTGVTTSHEHVEPLIYDLAFIKIFVFFIITFARYVAAEINTIDTLLALGTNQSS